jgi:diamine N-acetyltransferase
MKKLILFFKNKIKIRHAKIDEKKKVYEWLCCSDTTELHLGLPHYPECPVPTWEEFQKEFQDYYFLKSGWDKASVMIIENAGIEVGCVCYEMFYTTPGKAVLSIWLNSKKFIGQGFGSKALKLVIKYLHKKYSVTQFMLRPSIKNVFAIKVYQKIGFNIVQEKEKLDVVKEFIKPEFIQTYGSGDYGFEGSAILIKKV